MTTIADFDAARERARVRLAAELAAIAARKAELEPELPPATYAGPYLSLLASPHLDSYPEDVLKWLAGQAGEQGWPAVARIHPGISTGR